ncbi:prepro-urotensin II-beta-like [Oncorhynchus keta]|uniref:prepro-urotensin II-beta-like n=1 Tax=Oncorhynchus keta TaxID=8018 RepID=UPI0015F7A8FE|nr:prepro-urotensin II-beta-like [Oncorhynchus keta]
MQCKRFVSCVLLLTTAAGPLLTHPVSHSNGMSYTGTEEDQVVSPEELSRSDHTYRFYSAPGLGNLRSAVFSPDKAVREVLLETPALSPQPHFLGSRREYRKRTTTECFWKYCV